jgi:MscS family membrane protein
MEKLILIATQPTFGLNHMGVLQGEVGGYPLWQYAATLLWVVLAFLIAPVIDFIATGILKRLTAKTETNLDDKLLEILHRPVKVIVVLVALTIGVGAYEWPDWIEHILTVLFVLAVAITVTYVAVRLVDLLLEYFEQKFFAGDTQLAQLMLPVLGKTFKVFVIIIGILTTAQHLGMPVTSVLAGLGVGGVAVALAAQNSLANIFGSIVILTDRPFRVGDRIQVGDIDGSVETIGLRSTRIRTLEGHLVTMPNKTVADSNIINVSLRPNIRQLMTVSLTYDTTPEKMKDAVTMLREIFQKHPLTHDAWVYWRDYGPHSLDIFVVYWCKTTVYKDFLQALEELNLEIKRRFDAADLNFAFPTQTIQLQQAVPKA